jgi:hypothetical protein
LGKSEPVSGESLSTNHREIVAQMGMFTRAARTRVSLKIALTGPSGSGKTYSALKLAQGMGKRIALLDTENGSGSLYAGLGEYDTVQIESPYTIQKYLEVIRAAEKEGYEILIIDSLSHAWAGEGGLLDQKSAKDARGGNNFTNWAEISKQQETLKAAILHSPLHVIVTMRSKMEYVQAEDERGKKSVQKLGMAPIQRDGMEYEFTTVFDVDMQHYAATSKDRTGLFDGVNQQITEKHGERLMRWLSGAAVLTVTDPAPKETPQAQQETATTDAVASAAKREADERAAAKAEADTAAKQAFANFALTADKRGFNTQEKPALNLLARTLLKKDRPTTADLVTAINLPEHAWGLAIDDTHAELARQEVEAAKKAQQTREAISK